MDAGKHVEHNWPELEGISNLFEEDKDIPKPLESKDKRRHDEMSKLSEEDKGTSKALESKYKGWSFLDEMLMPFEEDKGWYDEMSKLPEEDKDISKTLEYRRWRDAFMSMPLEEDKRWSLHDEMSKLFNDSLDRCFPEFEEEADLFPSYKKEHGDYNCQNVLTIWPKLRKNLKLREDDPDIEGPEEDHPDIKGPEDVGEAIMKNLPNFDMMDGQPSVLDVGFVTFSLSPNWMAESIHKMLKLKDGIKTWAPKLPVETVMLKYPSLKEEIHAGVLRQSVLTETLYRMFSHSKVNRIRATYTYAAKEMHDSPLIILNKWFSIKERRGDVEIGVEDKPPFILAKRDLNHLSNDLEYLRLGFEKKKADWIIYVTPVRQQEYVEMCFTVAKLEKWTPTDRKWKWIPDGTSYLGYQASDTESKELASLLHTAEVDGLPPKVFYKDKDAQLLGYTDKIFCYAVLTYTILKTHRLANCTFTLGEMVGEEGNTFVYLLNIRAKIRCILTDYSREDIDELTKASEKNQRLGELEERVLEVHLLEYTQALKESCSYLSPHILCEYLYGLSKKFKNYHSSVLEHVLKPNKSKTKRGPKQNVDVGSVALLLCEATAIVMDECFDILGLDPDGIILNDYDLRSFVDRPKDVNAPVEADVLSDIESDKKTDQKAKNKQMMAEKEQEAKFILGKELVDRCITPCLVSVARDPPRNSRFELFSIRPYITTDPTFKKGKMFGFIAVSDKYGLLSDGVSHLFEPDFAYVPLFNQEWCDPINMHNGEYIYLGNPSSRHSVAFSSSIEISMDIYVTAEKNACFELCSRKFKLDLLKIWDTNSRNQCGCIDIKGEDGITQMHYILIKDAVDATLEIRYKTKMIADEARDCKVRGQIYAYYGSDILDQCRASMRPCYWALLFRSDVPFALKGDKIPLRKSELAVPKGARLKIFAYLYDVESEKVILDGICELSSLTEGSSKDAIEGLEGTGCSLSLKVDWTYQAQYL